MIDTFSQVILFFDYVFSLFHSVTISHVPLWLVFVLKKLFGRIFFYTLMACNLQKEWKFAVAKYFKMYVPVKK